VPLKETVLLPCVGWKFVPLIVTNAPTAPDVGEILVMVGGAITVKATPELLTPETVTTTLPVVAPLGTVVLILVSLQMVGVAVVPLNLSVLLPCDTPKFDPEMVIESPTIPEFGDKPEIAGVAKTVKLLPLLSTPLAWIMTFPVVAPGGTGAFIVVEFQLLGDANVPLKFTVPLP
jgi:hypothetical protein